MEFRISLSRLFFATTVFAIAFGLFFRASWWSSIVIGTSLAMLTLIVSRADTWRIVILAISTLGGAGMNGTYILGNPQGYPDILSFLHGAFVGGLLGWIAIRLVEVSGTIQKL